MAKRKVRKDGLYPRGRIWWTRIGGERVSTQCKDVKAALIVRARLEREAADPSASLARKTTMMDMLVHVLDDRRSAKGKTGGTLSKHTLEVWRLKLGHAVRLIGPKVPLAEVDYDCVSRFLADRGREPRAKGSKEPVSQHELSKDLGALRFGLRLEKQRGAYPHDVDHVTRTRRFAVGYKPRKRHLTWEEIPLLLSGLLLEAKNRVTAERLAKARALRDEGRTLLEIAAELHCAISTAKRYLTMKEPGPVLGGDVRSRHAAWFIATGGRDAESHRAELRDHDLTRWRVFMRGSKTGEAESVIPIAPPFRSLLAFSLEGAPEKGPIFGEWANVGRALKLACERAGIERVSPNDLRRTHSSLLSQAGIRHSDLKLVTRHTTTRMLDLVYAAGNIESVEGALDRVPADRNLLPGKKGTT